MTQTFGRRGSSPAPARIPLPPTPTLGRAEAEPDPRVAALLAAARHDRGLAPDELELGEYLARRERAIGLWRTLAIAGVCAPPAAAYLFGVRGPWLAAVGSLGAVLPPLLTRARRRWAREIEAEARSAQASTSNE